jgi:hypothetical protein
MTARHPGGGFMSAFTGRWPAGGLLLVPFVALFLGCGQRAAAPSPVVVQATPSAPTEPGEIELSEPKVTFVDPKTIRFEVRYRFTKGKPDKHYLCEISFPGTPNQGVKTMESHELKSEGVIWDRIVLFKPPVQTFEIRMSETDSPEKGYTKISNVVSGPVK